MMAMRVLTSDSAALTAEFGIQVGRWAQYAGIGDTPFGAMWCLVPPGGHTDTDCHSEREMWIVVSGNAEVRLPDRSAPALTGSAVLLDSEEPHVLVNRSETEPLVVLSLYWEPAAVTAGAAAADQG
jgi:mannose-6-phosphate isomerase-like protein (cupin superfamily)